MYPELTLTSASKSARTNDGILATVPANCERIRERMLKPAARRGERAVEAAKFKF